MKTLLISIKYIVLFVILLCFSIKGYTQNYLYEDFESGEKPAGWSYIKYGTTKDWVYQDGGYSSTGVPGTGHPPYAKEGFYNAMFQLESFSGERVRLVTPPIDLEFGIKPELAFWHAQNERYTFEQWRNDELRIFYREHVDSTWKKIAEYTNKVGEWAERIIQLPDSVLSNTFYIAFEGKTNNGYGVCIDSVAIVEKGVLPKYVEKVDVAQASTDFVATESSNNPILKVEFTVKGNDGQAVLDSLVVHSLNTDDSDLANNGVKLYASDDEFFSNTFLLKSGVNFVDGKATFTDLNRSLPTGLSSVWITYDIDKDINHEKHEHVLDAKIKANHIKINNSYYPIIDKSPEGERTLFESIFFDDFESDKGWEFTGEFEWGIPQGKGGNTKGAADPDYAVSGEKIIGTDLSGLGDLEGDYESNLTDRAYKATSPYVNAKYYKDTYLYFQRWFNMDSYDSSTIDINTQKADNWEKFWKSSGTSINNEWSQMKYNVENVISRKDSVSVRFTIGPTNDFWNYSGWNIDNVTIVGNYIGRDVAITEWIEPLGGCGHTEEEYVTVKIKNLAGEPMDEDLPISFSFDGGTTIYYDTIYTTIPVDDSLIYTIDKPVDLTTPGWYNNIYATTHLAGDEDNSNDRINKQIFITPTYNLPYSENFETNYGYYLTGGTNSSWEYGTPAGTLIDTAASGTNAWVTNLDGDYVTNESSYIESPCFNFGGADSIIFEFKCIGISEDQTDGLTVMYTFDEGENWSPLPNKHDYYWNWYNEENISALGIPGIDSVGGEWLTFRQLLPPEFSNQSLVKFRFVLASDDATTEEGFGIDDIKIYEAPYDVGVSSMDYPYNRCEWEDTTHVKVWIENYGPTAVKAGTDIPLVMKFNSTTTKDTLTLTEDLMVEDSTLFTFNSTVDMSYAGDYDFIIYTKLESDSYFYNDTLSNDSLVTTVSVLGMPRYNPFPDQMGDNPVDTFLVAGTGYTDYNWSGGGNPDIIAPQDTLYVDAAGWYYVTVTNAEGCTASDSVEVVNSEIDLTMEALFTELADSCERNILTDISIRIKNSSLNEFYADDSLAVAYQVNNEPIVRDTIILTETLTTTDPGDTVRFTFETPADFTTPGNYTFKVFTDYQKDLDHSDDTTTVDFNTWGYVEIDMAYDTIYSSQADTLKIGTTPGYTDYLWSTTETTDTISPPDNISRWYKVTVSDDNICGADTDSVYVQTYDFGISAINGFNDNCDYNFTSDSTLNVEITNYSGNLYSSGDTIRVIYEFDNSQTIKTITLTEDFIGNSSKYFDIGTIDARDPGEHSIKVFPSAKMDVNNLNDTLEHSFETWPYPEVNLAYDSIYTTKPDTVVLEATHGYASYLWNTGETTSSIEISKMYSENYIVQVEDENGCGIVEDSTQIITFDLGILDIIFPKNDCEHSSNENVIVTIKNYSQDTLLAGTIIDLAYEINENPIVNETLTLDNYLYPNQTKDYLFNTKADLSAIDTFYIKAFTDFNMDVKRRNDTLFDARVTYGYPTIELGDDIYTDQPDTVQIIAEPGFIKYEWNNGVENDTLNITYPASYEYIVTVTDINGCSTTDNLSIYTYDVKASALEAPVSQCEFTEAEEITITVQNNSMDTLSSGETISASYILNSASTITETFDLTEILFPDSTVDYTFAQTADLSENQTHEFKLFAKLTDIDVALEDTTSASVDFQKTELDLGDDENVTTQEYTIDAGAEFSTYLWFNGSTSQTYTVDINNQTPNKYYAVTVTNSFGCVAEDSIMVTFDLEPDIAVTQILSPESTCWIDGETYPVEIEITNEGVINLTTGTPIEVGYISDNGDPVIETHALTSDLAASASFNFTFADNISFPSGKEYEIKTFAKLTSDENIANDTLPETVNISAPEISLSPDNTDTIYFEDQVTLNPGSWDQYEWQNGSTSQTFAVTSEGWYSVTVTDEIGCQASDSVYCAIYDPNSIDHLITGNGYSIIYYPNPVSEELKIQVDTRKTLDIYIEIVNTHGQVIYNNKYSRVRDVVERINVNSYANGVYYIRFRIDNEFYVRKIIIQ